MKRAILLTSAGDPMLTKLWIRQYLKCVKDADTKLYVFITSNHPEPIKKWVADRFSELTDQVYTDGLLRFGMSAEALFNECREPLVMLMEDDCFFLNTEAVDAAFRGIEKNEYDVAGSPRMSCSAEVAEAARVKWNLDYTGLGDKGPNFWPNCFFARRSDLMKTDQDFKSHGWPTGTYIPYLDYTTKEDCAGDTFVHMSLQLRALGLKFKEIPQYHCSPYDLDDYKEHKGIWDGYAPWAHAGSLSTVASSFYEKNVPAIDSELGKLEQQKRYAWWLVAYELYKNNTDVVKDADMHKYILECRDQVSKLIFSANFSNKDMATLMEGYSRLL